MIVRMKKVTIVIKSSWMDDVLNTLGKIGVVHLQPVTPPENNTIVELKEKIQLMGKAVSIIPEKFVKDSPPSFNEEDGFILAKQLLGLAEEFLLNCPTGWACRWSPAAARYYFFLLAEYESSVLFLLLP